MIRYATNSLRSIKMPIIPFFIFLFLSESIIPPHRRFSYYDTECAAAQASLAPAFRVCYNKSDRPGASNRTAAANDGVRGNGKWILRRLWRTAL